MEEDQEEVAPLELINHSTEVVEEEQGLEVEEEEEVIKEVEGNLEETTVEEGADPRLEITIILVIPMELLTIVTIGSIIIVEVEADRSKNGKINVLIGLFLVANKKKALFCYVT